MHSVFCFAFTFILFSMSVAIDTNIKSNNNKRETDQHMTDHEGAWSPWLHALSPVLKVDGSWYIRDEVSLDRTKLLTTKIGGIYEIGVKWKNEGSIYCFYVGRATKVRQSAKGITLRGRLYSNYAHNGGDFRYELDEFLSRGFHVYFRFITLTTVTECVQLERKLYTTYDYAFNKADSPTPYRSPNQVLFPCPVTGNMIPMLPYIDHMVLNEEEQKVYDQIQILLQTIKDPKQKQKIINRISVQ